jgi:hypothetical protein
MPKLLTRVRNVSQRECPWLGQDMKAGEHVWSYTGHTYSAVSPTGTPVTAKAAETPFFELLTDALR